MYNVHKEEVTSYKNLFFSYFSNEFKILLFNYLEDLVKILNLNFLITFLSKRFI